jgi:hypothetical protein
MLLKRKMKTMKVNPINLWYSTPGLHLIAPTEQATKNTISHTSHMAYVHPVAGPAAVVHISREARDALARSQA